MVVDDVDIEVDADGVAVGATEDAALGIELVAVTSVEAVAIGEFGLTPVDASERTPQPANTTNRVNKINI
ncbi:hypothetical protein BC351_19670 [Paenibacillus ferrarius]|uniref:Uncharacterized protein n=1 Tax=Paenibacillus ferrarius TaxID=1469647 RepID=A0A1V4HNZ2_9BACL|nr:hypothetical protein BC351_19670 [Paenibacillus ferrarius]